MRVGIPGHEYFFGSDKCLRKRFGWASGGPQLGLCWALPSLPTRQEGIVGREGQVTRVQLRVF